ncbi:MAG TPA: MarR family winged helix-turn-helix transcriptional regulator [Humidesulfovibrio sp.]|nr:MarR family winged helix-turn-helix transcriptional regulator [Humidesulfovibrio sp.]
MPSPETATPGGDAADTKVCAGPAPEQGIGSRCACYNLRRASRAVTRFYDGMLAPSGLRSTQFSILAATNTSGPMTMGALAERLATERTTLTRNLALLEAKGFILSETGQDRREHRIRITPAGRAALQGAMPHWTAAQEAMRQHLGQDRLEHILKDLAALTAAAQG